MEDEYAAFCFDEACGWMLAQTEQGKRPFFAAASGGNAAVVSCMKQWGAEVKHFD